MAQQRGYPTVLESLGAGSALVGGSVVGALSDESDDTYVTFGYGPGGESVSFDLKGWNLAAPNPAKAAKSSMMVLRVRALLTQVGGALFLSVVGPTATTKPMAVYCPSFDYEIQDRLFFFPNTAAYWNGDPASLVLHCEFRTDIEGAGQASNGKLTHCSLYYGEADGFVDVGANVAYEVTTAGGYMITNPTGAANGTADHATFLADFYSREMFNYLARRIPAFTLPAGASYAGVEFHDVLDENLASGGDTTALLGIYFTVGNYPASSPDSITPRGGEQVLSDPFLVGATLKYPGAAAAIYFGGPGESVAWGGSNGWPGINAARLMAGGYEFRSQVFLYAAGEFTAQGQYRGRPIWLYDLQVRVFYDLPTAAKAAPLMVCDR